MCLKCIPTNNLRDKYLGDLPPIFKDAMLQLYDGKITPEQLHGGLLQLIAQELWQGVSIGFDTDLSKHDEQSQHYRMVKAMRTNVYVFSGFKTYKQLKEASLLMVDADGNIKPFTQFLKDVQAINKNYNVNYLRAEYDNALVSAQMAAKWEDFEALANDFPLLKFVATIDDRTSAICERLKGLTKPFDWPGWNKYMLPLHWGERSNIIQIADGDISDVNETDLPEPQKMFANNVGKTGIIFPETHPYFDVNNKKVKKIIEFNSINNEPYRLIERRGKYKLQTHATFEKYESNINETMRIARFIFSQNHSVQMLKINPFKSGLKNPDCLINNEVFEIKASKSLTRSSIDKVVKDAAKQADNILLEINESFDIDTTIKIISERVRRAKNLKTVWIKLGDKLHKFTADEIRKL